MEVVRDGRGGLNFLSVSRDRLNPLQSGSVKIIRQTTLFEQMQ